VALLVWGEWGMWAEPLNRWLGGTVIGLVHSSGLQILKIVA